MQGFNFVADTEGLDGNDITVQFFDAGASSSGITVEVVGGVIQVTAGDDETHGAIATAINNHGTAGGLVTVTADDGAATTDLSAETVGLTGGGANFEVSATQQEVKDAIDAVGSTGLTVAVETAGAEVVSIPTALDFIDGDSEAQTTFTFTLEDTEGTYGQATASFSDSSGATTIKLGDVSFTVNNRDMFEGDTAFDNGEIALTIDNLIRVTDRMVTIRK